ncbi:MAG: zf-HC2 domain-containing protein [Candidatus Krumholzibacteria bacterium]|nr:zf-HC2 domain-containing protein [Candidatus Krumholzibacteria bacterium]
MNCRRAKTLINDFIDGVISDQDRIGLEQHLGGCSTCESLASAMTKSLELLHRMPQAQPSDNFNWKVRLGIAKARNASSVDAVSKRYWLKSWNIRFAVSALSTFVVVAASGYFVLKGKVLPDDKLTFSAPRQVVDVHSPVNTAAKRQEKALGVGAVGPTVVSTDDKTSPGRLESPGLLQELPGPTLHTDSLTSQFFKSQIDRFRMGQLEKQVEILQSELRKCEQQDQ